MVQLYTSTLLSINWLFKKAHSIDNLLCMILQPTDLCYTMNERAGLCWAKTC